MKKPSAFRYLLLIIPAIAVAGLTWFVYTRLAAYTGVEIGSGLPDWQKPTAAAPVEVEDTSVFDAAIQAAVEELKAEDPGFALYNATVNNVELAADGRTAVIWLESYDPETGELLAREPELAVAKVNPAGPKGSRQLWMNCLRACWARRMFNATSRSFPNQRWLPSSADTICHGRGG